MKKNQKLSSSIRDIPLPKYIVKLLRDHKRKSKSKNVIARIMEVLYRKIR